MTVAPIFVLTLALGSVLLMLLLAGRCQRTTAIWLSVGFLLVVTAAFASWKWPLNGARGFAAKIENRPIEAADASGHYISSRSCQSCHPGPYQSWHTSYHRTMTQEATPATVLANFDDVTVTAYEREFRLYQRGDEFWVDMLDLDAPDGTDAERVDRRIVLLTGSHHIQVYWYTIEQDRRLGQLPVIWLREANRWIPFDSAFLRPPAQPLSSRIGAWNTTCIKCHTTNGQPRTGWARTEPVDTQVTEFGISCEACHGPGGPHASANRNPARRYGFYFGDGPDETMVRPDRLSHRSSSQICGQCHSIWIPDQDELATFLMKSGLSYRPGDELSETRHVFHAGQERTPHVEAVLASDPHFFSDRFWPDGMERVSGREYNGLLRSPCYQKGTLSCLSCHQMHKDDNDSRSDLEWANDQLAPRMESDQACLQCHQVYADTRRMQDHTHHAPTSPGSRCYNCHMPHTTYGLLKAIRSPRFGSTTGRPLHGCPLSSSPFPPIATGLRRIRL